MGILTNRWIQPVWWSFAVMPLLSLAVVGLVESIRTSGGTLAEWYFVSYEAMYALWSWPTEDRFVIPVAPLACLYVWRGACTVARVSLARPHAVALGVLSVSLAAFVGLRASDSLGGLQARLSMVAWAALAVAAGCMLYARPTLLAGANQMAWRIAPRALATV